MDKKVKNYFKKQKLTAASSRISHYTYWRYATRARVRARTRTHARTHIKNYYYEITTSKVTCTWSKKWENKHGIRLGIDSISLINLKYSTRWRWRVTTGDSHFDVTSHRLYHQICNSLNWYGK